MSCLFLILGATLPPLYLLSNCCPASFSFRIQSFYSPLPSIQLLSNLFLILGATLPPRLGSNPSSLPFLSFLSVFGVPSSFFLLTHVCFLSLLLLCIALSLLSFYLAANLYVYISFSNFSSRDISLWYRIKQTTEQKKKRHLYLYPHIICLFLYLYILSRSLSLSSFFFSRLFYCSLFFCRFLNLPYSSVAFSFYL